MRSRAPASVKTAKSKISKTSLSIDKDPPMNASGTDDIKYGVSILILITFLVSFYKLQFFHQKI